MSSVFSYDALTGPAYVDWNGIAAGYGILSAPIGGFLTGDEIQTVTLVIVGTGLTRISLAIDMVQRTSGYYEWTSSSAISAHFTMTGANIAAIAAIAAATSCTYSVSVMILRNGVQETREVQAGAISARAALPLPPLIVNSIVISGGPISDAPGETAQLTATTRDGLGNVVTGIPITWASTNENIAPVDVNGLVTLITPGEVTISATCQYVTDTTTATCTTAPLVPSVGDIVVFNGLWAPHAFLQGQSAGTFLKTNGSGVLSWALPLEDIGLGQLDDVTIAGTTTGQFLTKSAGDWVNHTLVSADISDATSANVASRAVIRDGSGNFAGGLITAATGLTVLAGTAALQAVTGTTGAFSGLMTALAFTGALTNALTFGTHLTGASYNNSSAVSLATDATSANTVGTIISRDGSGNFSAGAITATSHVGPLAKTLTFGTYLTGTSFNNAADVTIATNATSANTASTLVARDGSGNFSAGIVTATLSGAAPAGSLSGATLASNVVNTSITSTGILASPHVTSLTVDSGGLTITLGTLAAQALTATSGAFSTTLGVTGLSTQSQVLMSTSINPSGNAARMATTNIASTGEFLSRLDPNEVGAMSFYDSISGTTNGYAPFDKDWVRHWGWNTNVSFGPVDATKDAIAISMESNWRPNATETWFECHLQWWNVATARVARPWSFSCAKTGPNAGRVQGLFTAELLDVIASDSVTPVLRIVPNMIRSYGAAGTERLISIGDSAGGGSALADFGVDSTGANIFFRANYSATSDQWMVVQNAAGGTITIARPVTFSTGLVTMSQGLTVNNIISTFNSGLYTAKLQGATTTLHELGTSPASAASVTLSLLAGTSGGASQLALKGSGSTLLWQQGAANAFQQYMTSGDTNLYLRDLVNARMHATYAPASTSAAAMTTFLSQMTIGATLTVNAGGVSVIAGTTAVQAFTATTAVFSSTVSSSGFTGPLTGNASTATALQTGRAINGVTFDGTAAITVTAASNTLTGTTLASNVVTSSLTSTGILANPHMTGGVVDSGGFTITLGGLTVAGGTTTVQQFNAGDSTLHAFGTSPASASNVLLAIAAGTSGGNAQLSLRGSGSTVLWQQGNTNSWQQYMSSSDTTLYLRDIINAKMHVQYAPGATAALASTRFVSTVTIDTGLTVTANGITVVAGTSALQAMTATTGGFSGNVTVASITSGTWTATAVAAQYGGTGQTSYTTGDFLYASGASALSKRAIGSTGQILKVVGGLPDWSTPTTFRSVTLEYPSAAEKTVMFFTIAGLTVSQIEAVLFGSSTPSVTFAIRYGTDVSAAGTEVVTSGSTVTSVSTGLAITSFNSATIPANNFVWITTTAQSGTVSALHVTVTGS